MNTNPEKVINGLKVCIADFISRDTCKLTKCPYACIKDQGIQHYECRKTLLKDALELLKEYEPRVLTLEEIARSEVVWLECNGICDDMLEPAIPWDVDITDETWQFVMITVDTMFLQEYEKTWRCWNQKPSDEQRKDVKWNG